MHAKITAIGTAHPLYKSTQLKVAELIATGFHLNARQKKILKAIYKASGVEFRYSVISDYEKIPGEFTFFPNTIDADFPSTAERMQLYKEHALFLALAAISDCLAHVNSFKKSTITHLITVSCTGMYAPGLDIEIVQALSLSSTIKRTCINFMGCYGAFNALKVAHAFCQADTDAKVLVVCVELCSIHLQKKFSIENIVSNALFADGAAAVLIQGKSSQHKYFSLTSFYCDLLPQTSKEMAWTISDYGFDIVLSSYVPEAIKKGIACFTKNLLSQINLSLEDIDYYAIHPGGIKILQACEDSLNISPLDNKYSYDILRNYGNMSSATVLFVLKSIWEDKTIENNKKIFSCAFGPGLTIESMLLTTHYMNNINE